jgi:hypothetical protein
MREKAINFINKHSTKQKNGCLLWKTAPGRENISPTVSGCLSRYYQVNCVAHLVYLINNNSWDGVGIIKTICGNKRCVELSHLNLVPCSKRLGFVNEECYNYYRGGKYIFYSKLTKQEITLNRKEHIVEKGKVFHITYTQPFGEIVKTELTNVGVLRTGEVLV